MPKRIQMTRQTAWRRDHPRAVIVDRRSDWGNPFRIGDAGVPDAATATVLFRSAVLLSAWAEGVSKASMEQVSMGEDALLLMHFMTSMPGPLPRLHAIREHLRGRDLACWCALDQPCHADVLIELANGES